MKLLFLIKGLALPGGGAERVLADVTAILLERGHLVTVASYDAPGAADFYQFDPKVKRVRLGIGRTAKRAGLAETLRRMAALRRMANEEDPDVAVGFMHSVYLPLGFALKKSGIPLIASEHIVFGHYRTRPLEAFLLWCAAPLFAAITALSTAVIGGYPRRVRRRMTVVPNPVGWSVKRLADVAGDGRKRLLTVGRLAQQKDHRTLVEAFTVIASEFPDWDLRIVGDGELRGDLDAQIAATGLQSRIALPGSIAEIEPEYCAAQLFAIPSLYESFGLATAEALAHGLPVIGFGDCPGTNELIVDGHNGLLVSGPNRAAALADGLRTLMKSEELRRKLGASGPASVEQYSIASVADAWESLLMKVVNAKSATAGND